MIMNALNGDFIYSMVEEMEFCTDIMKKHFNNKLVMTKDDHEDFENSNEVEFATMSMLMVLLK